MIWCFIVFYFANKTRNQRSQYFKPVSDTLPIIDFILNLSLTIVFIYKIKHKDSLEGIEIADDYRLTSVASSNFDYSTDKRAIWNVLIKHCILFGIVLFINQSFYISIILSRLSIVKEVITTQFVQNHTIRSIENVVNIVVLWLVLKINNDKYICLCKCWHKCILKNCMKEDPNMIREGFVVNGGDGISIKQVPLLLGVNRNANSNRGDLMDGNDVVVITGYYNGGSDDYNQCARQSMNELVSYKRTESSGKIEGHDLIVTKKSTLYIEGQNVLPTS